MTCKGLLMEFVSENDNATNGAMFELAPATIFTIVMSLMKTVTHIFKRWFSTIQFNKKM